MSCNSEGLNSTTIAEQAKSITEIVEKLQHKAGALLPILHAIQNQQGYVPSSAIPIIASALSQTNAEIHGVISFYHEFRTQPPGEKCIQICRAEACQARGSRDLEAHAKSVLGIDYHETTSDNKVSLFAAYCLGNCALGPNIRVDNKIIGRVSNQRFDRILLEME